jgi:hypothetical protein
MDGRCPRPGFRYAALRLRLCHLLSYFLGLLAAKLRLSATTLSLLVGDGSEPRIALGNSLH